MELTKKPLALASALEKISRDPLIEAVKREDVAQMFIEHPSEKKKGFSPYRPLILELNSNQDSPRRFMSRRLHRTRDYDAFPIKLQGYYYYTIFKIVW